MKKILFVCTGNTCRSPMAEAFLRELIKADPELSGEFSAASAGIYAFEGDEASREAIDVMKSDWGIELSAHRAKALLEEDVKEAYLILTMTEDHRNHITSFYPEAAGKVQTLKEYAGSGGSGGIPDPFGRSAACYSKSAEEIRNAVLMAAEKLKKSR